MEDFSPLAGCSQWLICGIIGNLPDEFLAGAWPCHALSGEVKSPPGDALEVSFRGSIRGQPGRYPCTRSNR